jgi:hypothetical protein
MKHIIENLGNGKILIKDITPSEEYDSLGVNLSTDVVGITFTIAKYDSEDVHSFSIPTDKLQYLREYSGYVLDTSIEFEDYIYETRLAYVTTTDETIESEYKSLFVKNLTRKIIHLNKNTVWKEYFGYYSTTLKTPIRRLSWLYDIKCSFEAGLYEESIRILKALEKIC